MWSCCRQTYDSCRTQRVCVSITRTATGRFCSRYTCHHASLRVPHTPTSHPSSPGYLLRSLLQSSYASTYTSHYRFTTFLYSEMSGGLLLLIILLLRTCCEENPTQIPSSLRIASKGGCMRALRKRSRRSGNANHSGCLSI